MKLVALSSAIASLVVLAACAGRQQPQVSPAAVAAVHADMRLVGNETTWVTRGTGYELVGRSKVDLAIFQPQLDRDADVLHRVFPGDTLAPLVVTVRRAPAEGKPFVPAAPIPSGAHGTVVELVIPNPKAHSDRDEGRGGGGFAERNPTLPAVRAWLSAHATALTKQPAHMNQAEGEVDDPRVPAWAEELIPGLTQDSLVDPLTTTLAAHPSELIPLPRYFTMALPTFVAASEQRGGENRGEGGGGGGRYPGGGYGGGMGRGMGGGGRRGGMGGGGMGRGGGERRSEESRPLMGPALFAAQSIVFGKYLSHEGYDAIGAVVDGQILGAAPDSILAKRGMLSLERMDVDWRAWLSELAAALAQ